MKTTTVEFWEGYHGRNADVDLMDNPYKANQDSKEFADWEDGWNAAYRVDNQMRDIINN